MSSTHRIAANRANGSKSRGPLTPEGKRASVANSVHSTGPVTPQGKARASRNAVKHGLLAQSVVLPSECSDAFDVAFAALRDELRPSSYIEHRLVEIMAVADWRRTRAWHMEMAQHTHAIRALQSAADPLAAQENSDTPSMHTALAFADLSSRSGAMRNLHRYEVRLSREFLRHLRLYETRCAEAAAQHRISKRTKPKAG